MTGAALKIAALLKNTTHHMWSCSTPPQGSSVTARMNAPQTKGWGRGPGGMNMLPPAKVAATLPLTSLVARRVPFRSCPLKQMKLCEKKQSGTVRRRDKYGRLSCRRCHSGVKVPLVVLMKGVISVSCDMTLAPRAELRHNLMDAGSTA
jgi:hypothetical protein